ncbi:MAG: FG-GAP-like repeat-containing protein [Hyphomicrobiales bacterium]
MNRFNTAILTALLILLPTAVFAAAKTVAIVPFKVNAEKDMSFLRDGIYDMLSSRLYKEGQVEVINRQRVEKALGSVGGAVTEANARDVGKLLGADFILIGSLTVLGNSVSVDSKMLDVSGAKPTMSFFEQSEDAGGIVTRVNQMAAEINDKMFGIGAVAKSAAGGSVAAPQAQAAQPGAPDTHTHPEKMFRQQTGFGTEGRESPFTTEESGGRELNPQFWRSASYNLVFNGIALGDVDGDGKVETVVITPKSVLIYRFDQQRFQKIAEITEGIRGTNIGVDVADINGNGIPEIFVTSLSLTRRGLESFVLEYDGKSYKRIVDSTPWYFRVCSIPDRGKALLGQEHRIGTPFSGRIYEMAWRNGQYEPDVDLLANNRDANVLGLTISDLIKDQKETVVAYDSNDHIRIFDAGGKELYKTAEKFGGTTLYYVADRSDVGETERPLYFTTRLLPLTDQDGKSRILAVKNYDIAGLKLEKFRSFNESQFMAFFWDGLGLAQDWRTRKFAGCIRDFAIGDFNNDGKTELVAAVVLDEARVIGTTPKCTLIALELK